METYVETAPRALLEPLLGELRTLHRALLEAGRRTHEAAAGPEGAGHRLEDLARADPHFAWDRRLRHVVDDLAPLLREPEPPTWAEAAAIRAELEDVFSPGFWEERRALLHDPELAAAYRRVRGALDALPGSTPDAEALHEQHRWAAARAKRAAF